MHDRLLSQICSDQTVVADEIAVTNTSSAAGISCPICRSSSSTVVRFRKEEIPICDCLQCNHRFAHVLATPSHVAKEYGDEYFSGGGAGYPDYLALGSMLIARGEMYARLLSTKIATGRVWDV
jgi:Zn ribbon nucleic-acid-binding protein